MGTLKGEGGEGGEGTPGWKFSFFLVLVIFWSSVYTTHKISHGGAAKKGWGGGGEPCSMTSVK